VKRAVFLDRDGVLVEPVVRDGRAIAPLTLDAFSIVPSAAADVRRLRRAGLPCIVFTNQPELAQGSLAPSALATMHAALRQTVAVDDVLVCPHHASSGCACHKPRPGMLYQAARTWGVSLADSYVIGDRWRDIEAGCAGGCYTILLDRPYSACSTADARVGSLTEAVDLVLARIGGSQLWTSPPAT